MYNVVYWDESLSSGFYPQTYLFFKVKVDKAVNAFQKVNQRVGKVCGDIEEIKGNLNSLQEKFNTYQGLADNMEQITTALATFKESLITNNTDLLNAAITTCDKIAENNTNYFNQAMNLKEDLAKITSYQDTEVTGSEG